MLRKSKRRYFLVCVCWWLAASPQIITDTRHGKRGSNTINVTNAASPAWAGNGCLRPPRHPDSTLGTMDTLGYTLDSTII